MWEAAFTQTSVSSTVISKSTLRILSLKTSTFLSLCIVDYSVCSTKNSYCFYFCSFFWFAGDEKHLSHGGKIVHPRQLTCMETQNFVEDRDGCHPTGLSYVYHWARGLACMSRHDLALLCHTSAALTASCRRVCKKSNFSKQSNRVSRISLRKFRLDLVGLWGRS